MMRPYEAVIHSALLSILLAACDGGMPPPVKFGQSGEGYATKIDFARLEHELPLSPASPAQEPGPGVTLVGSAEGPVLFFGPFARRRPGRREMSEGVRVQTRTTCRMPPSPTRGDCKASGLM